MAMKERKDQRKSEHMRERDGGKQEIEEERKTVV